MQIEKAPGPIRDPYAVYIDEVESGETVNETFEEHNERTFSRRPDYEATQAALEEERLGADGDAADDEPDTGQNRPNRSHRRFSLPFFSKNREDDHAALNAPQADDNADYDIVEYDEEGNPVEKTGDDLIEPEPVSEDDDPDTEPAGFGHSVGKRVATGTAFSLTIAACLLISPITTIIAVAVLCGFCSYEFYRMMHVDGRLPNDIAGVVVSTLYPIAFYIGGSTLAISLTMLFMGVLLVWYVFSPRTRITDLAITLFGSVYCGLMLSSLMLIRMGEPGITGGFL
ncbi:MAG: phosphatidate cytidylyltransferase, partial [Coriobacteriales bacterium]|nr:phosphatidate cytidylyltransferase [Coriobacteriales bacterium]